VPEFIDPHFRETSPKRSYSVIENDRIRLVFTKTGSIISGTGNSVFPNLRDDKGEKIKTKVITDYCELVGIVIWAEIDCSVMHLIHYLYFGGKTMHL
jgi:hypothetical protein